MLKDILNLKDRRRSSDCYFEYLLKTDDFPCGFISHPSHMFPPIDQHLTQIFVSDLNHIQVFLELISSKISHILVFLVLMIFPSSFIFAKHELFFLLLKTFDFMCKIFQQILIVIRICVEWIFLSLLLLLKKIR